MMNANNQLPFRNGWQSCSEFNKHVGEPLIARSVILYFELRQVRRIRQAKSDGGAGVDVPVPWKRDPA